MKYIKFILCLLFGLMFINAGLDKFLHYMPMPEMKPEQAKLFAAFGDKPPVSSSSLIHASKVTREMLNSLQTATL